MNGASTDYPASYPTDARAAAGPLKYTRLGLAAAFFWLLLGAFAWTLMERIGMPVVQLMLGNFGASTGYSGILVGSVPAALALLVLPVIGYYSDRYRSPWGRRIPFLAMTIPLVAISMTGLAASPMLGEKLDFLLGASSPGSDGSVLICLAVFWTLFAFADILGILILGALVNDVVPPRIIGRFFGAYRGLGLIAGVAFNYYLFGWAANIYVMLFLYSAVFTAVAIGLLCAKVREGSYPPPPSPPNGWGEINREARGYFRDCFGSSFYWLLFIAWALGWTAWSPVNYYSVPISTQLITSAHYANLLTLTYTVSFVLAYPIGMLADRFHPLRLAIIFIALYALATLWGGLFATTPLKFDIAFILHGVLSGSYVTATASLLQRLLPRMKFAQFASAAGIVVCLWNILIVPVAGYILSVTHKNYLDVFLLSSAQGWVALIATIFLYRAFVTRGGDLHYVAPGEDDPPASAPAIVPA